MKKIYLNFSLHKINLVYMFFCRGLYSVHSVNVALTLSQYLTSTTHWLKNDVFKVVLSAHRPIANNVFKSFNLSTQNILNLILS